jgi:hypothetical protein
LRVPRLRRAPTQEATRLQHAQELAHVSAWSSSTAHAAPGSRTICSSDHPSVVQDCIHSGLVSDDLHRNPRPHPRDWRIAGD